MNPLVGGLERLAVGFNELALWRGECAFWGLRFTAASFERWLYLRLHRLGRMGREERATLEKIVRPGMTVLDVGGNIGLYTVLLSRLVGPAGRVISFEPDPALFALLRENCALNGCTNVEAHNLALGRRHQTHDRLHGSRFAGAVAAEQRHDFARTHLQRHAVQDMGAAVIGMQVPHQKHQCMLPR